MRARRLFSGFGALLVGAALVLSWPAGAGSGSFNDPDDVAGGIDIKTVTHTDTSSTITYTLEAYQTWPDTDDYAVAWDLGLDNNAADTEACVFVANQNGGSFEEAAVYDECDETMTLANATASKSGATLTVSFAKSALSAASRPLASNDTTYTYRVFAQNTTAGTEDVAPDDSEGPITHTLGAQAETTTTAGGGTSTTAGGGTSTTAGGGTSTTRPNTTTTVDSAGTTTTAPPSSTSPPPCPSPSRAAITPSTAVPGQEVTVRGGGRNCFKPNATLEVVYTSTPVVLGTTTSDAFGQYAVTVKIPRNTTSGSHTITVRGPAASSGTHSSVGGITIVRGSLPRTGSDPGDMARLGLFALGAGALLALAGLRYRETVVAGVRHHAKHFRR